MHGNGLLPELEIDAAAGGYLPAGAFEWDDCLYVSVYLVQGLVVATAAGAPVTRPFEPDERERFGLTDSARRWELTTPFAVLGVGTLSPNGPGTPRPVPSTVAAVAVMRNGAEDPTLFPWPKKPDTGAITLL